MKTTTSFYTEDKIREMNIKVYGGGNRAYSDYSFVGIGFKNSWSMHEHNTLVYFNNNSDLVEFLELSIKNMQGVINELKRTNT